MIVALTQNVSHFLVDVRFDLDLGHLQKDGKNAVRWFERPIQKETPPLFSAGAS